MPLTQRDEPTIGGDQPSCARLLGECRVERDATLSPNSTVTWAASIQMAAARRRSSRGFRSFSRACAGERTIRMASRSACAIRPAMAAVSSWIRIDL